MTKKHFYGNTHTPYKHTRSLSLSHTICPFHTWISRLHCTPPLSHTHTDSHIVEYNIVHYTYSDGYTIFFGSIWKFHNHFGASFFLTIVEWPKTAHHSNAILGCNFTFSRHVWYLFTKTLLSFSLKKMMNFGDVLSNCLLYFVYLAPILSLFC